LDGVDVEVLVDLSLVVVVEVDGFFFEWMLKIFDFIVYKKDGLLIVIFGEVYLFVDVVDLL